MIPKYNFSVGPAQLYAGVEDVLCENIRKGYGSLSHRSQEFTDISSQGIRDFREFFVIPDAYKVYYTYSATESLELAMRALGEKKSSHCINGTFGWVWGNIAKKNGKDVEIHEEILGTRVSPKVLENTDADIVCVTANETSSGICYSPEEIIEIRKSLPKETLLAIDCTSSMGGIAYDFSSADVWAFSVQKAIGLPAGLGFLVVSDRAYKRGIEKENRGFEAGNHHCFSALQKKMEPKCQTPTTPNVLNIFAFGFVCKSLLDHFSSIENLEQKTKEKADFLYSFFDSHSDFQPFIKNKNHRSQTIIVIEGTFEKIRDITAYLLENDILVGSGYGLQKATQIRIANFPVHSLPDMKHFVSFF